MVSHFCHLSVIPSFSLVFRHAPLRSYISDPVSSSWPFLVLITKGVVTIALSLSHYMQLSNVLEESGLPPPPRFIKDFWFVLPSYSYVPEYIPSIVLIIHQNEDESTVSVMSRSPLFI